MLFGTEIFELKILDAISAAFSCRAMDYIMPKLTMLGNGGVLWILIAVFMLAVKKYRGTGIKLAAALIGCLIAVNIVLKPLVARPRPCWLNESVLLLIKTPHDYSFPSGHAAASFASACVLLTYNKKAGIAALILANVFICAFSDRRCRRSIDRLSGCSGYAAACSVHSGAYFAYLKESNPNPPEKT